MAGGIISHLLLKSAHLRIDGILHEVPSVKAQDAAKKVESRGVLIGAGFIAGESIMGVFIAVLIVAKINLPEIFGVGMLNNLLSLIFFGWFVGVFIWLATRALPKGGSLFGDVVVIVAESIGNLLQSLKPKQR